MNVEPIRTLKADQMPVLIFESSEALGARAADDLTKILAEAIADHGLASVILATGNSQLSFMKALRSSERIEWKNVVVFHMDEYLGMSDQHPASFPRYIREKLTNIVHPREFFPMRGDAPDLEAELKRYTELLEQYPPDACVLGIGENGHLAFNDPPADLKTEETIHIVTLDAECRIQQVGGAFRHPGRRAQASLFAYRARVALGKARAGRGARSSQSRGSQSCASGTGHSRLSVVHPAHPAPCHALPRSGIGGAARLMGTGSVPGTDPVHLTWRSPVP